MFRLKVFDPTASRSKNLQLPNNVNSRSLKDFIECVVIKIIVVVYSLDALAQ